MLKRLALASVLLAAAACYPTTTIVLVRHAERPPGTDPDLLPEGRRRAGDLARALERSQVSAIYHTSLKRTKQTAESLSARSGVPLTEISVAGAADAHVADVVRRVTSHKGRPCTWGTPTRCRPSFAR
jgi:phosphohistidine phosphatase SixA